MIYLNASNVCVARKKKISGNSIHRLSVLLDNKNAASKMYTKTWDEFEKKLRRVFLLMVEIPKEKVFQSVETFCLQGSE